jgi:hypothetical protein
MYIIGIFVVIDSLLRHHRLLSKGDEKSKENIAKVYTYSRVFADETLHVFAVASVSFILSLSSSR